MIKDALNSQNAKLTRRQAMRLTGMAALASSAFIPAATSQNQKSAAAKPAGTKKCRAAQSSPSTFLTAYPTTSDQDKSAAKYESGDSLAVFPLSAFWLLVTTDNWDEFLNKPGWIGSLVEEFGRENKRVSCDELTVLKTTMQGIWDDLNSSDDNKAALGRVRTVFLNRRQVINVYGHPPCPGGGTFLDIGGSVPKKRKGLNKK